jgi:hypothetical protein
MTQGTAKGGAQSTHALLLLRARCRCQPADIFGDVLPKLGVGAQVASEQVRRRVVAMRASTRCQCAACNELQCAQPTVRFTHTRHALTQRVNDAAYASKMASAVETWVSCWSSKDKGDLDARLHTGELLCHRRALQRRLVLLPCC